MKNAYINQAGARHREWVKARAKLIKEAVEDGRLSIDNGYPEGICEDCKQWHPLTPDHRRRRSQGGEHTKENIDWVCVKCHRKRDQEGDPLGKKEKSKKAKWEVAHSCKHCKKTTEILICHHCKKISV